MKSKKEYIYCHDSSDYINSEHGDNLCNYCSEILKILFEDDYSNFLNEEIEENASELVSGLYDTLPLIYPEMTGFNNESDFFRYNLYDTNYIVADELGGFYDFGIKKCNKSKKCNCVEEYVIYDEMSNETCGICLNKYKKMQKYYKLDCGHMFHKKCFKKWMKIELLCPYCK